MSATMIDLPEAGAMLLTAPHGSLCQSLAHDWHEDVPATTLASVVIAPNIVADVCLCAPCTAGLTAATDSAGG